MAHLTSFSFEIILLCGGGGKSNCSMHLGLFSYYIKVFPLPSIGFRRAYTPSLLTIISRWYKEDSVSREQALLTSKIY